GGWHDWDAPFDGMEVQNTASDFRRLYGPLLPFRLARFAFDRDAVLRELWVRPAEELAQWDALLAAGRRIPGFAGVDAHQNVSLLGWQLDPYAQQFGGARMVCPEAPLEARAGWQLLRSGACAVRWAVYEPRAAEAVSPGGRVDPRLARGAALLGLRNPPSAPPLYSSP